METRTSSCRRWWAFGPSTCPRATTRSAPLLHALNPSTTPIRWKPSRSRRAALSTAAGSRAETRACTRCAGSKEEGTAGSRVGGGGWGWGARFRIREGGDVMPWVDVQQGSGRRPTWAGRPVSCLLQRNQCASDSAAGRSTSLTGGVRGLIAQHSSQASAVITHSRACSRPHARAVTPFAPAL
jgi:hypothetical protein